MPLILPTWRACDLVTGDITSSASESCEYSATGRKVWALPVFQSGVHQQEQVMADNPEFCFIFGRARNVSLSTSVQNGSGVHRTAFPVVKAIGNEA